MTTENLRSGGSHAHGEPRLDHIMQIGTGFMASKTLLSAVELELFTELAKHPEDLATLSGRLGLHPRSARDFLDALVALKLLDRRTASTTTRPQPIYFWIRGSLRILAGYWRWPTSAFIRTGVI
jgi:hypothetical protein